VGGLHRPHNPSDVYQFRPVPGPAHDPRRAQV